MLSVANALSAAVMSGVDTALTAGNEPSGSVSGPTAATAAEQV